MLLGGIERIKKLYNKTVETKGRIDEQTGGFIKKNTRKETILETDGSNLKEILKEDGVDPERTISNNVYEITEVLGIEAARMALINEIRNVLGVYGIYINYRHLSVLCDWMTFRGKLTPINRNGINRVPHISALRKSSFEETVEILYDAAIFSELDELTGVTENIIFGQTCELGTGGFKLLVDCN